MFIVSIGPHLAFPSGAFPDLAFPFGAVLSRTIYATGAHEWTPEANVRRADAQTAERPGLELWMRSIVESGQRQGDPESGERDRTESGSRPGNTSGRRH